MDNKKYCFCKTRLHDFYRVIRVSTRELLHFLYTQDFKVLAFLNCHWRNGDWSHSEPTLRHTLCSRRQTCVATKSFPHGHSAPAESICMHVLETHQTTNCLRDQALGHGSQRAKVTFCWSDPLEARCKHNSLHNPLRSAGITNVLCRCASADH
jgi:hypothetical protein